MKIGLIGCVQSSENALKTLLALPNVEVAAVVTRKSSQVNNDFCDLSSICENENIPYHYENRKEKRFSTEFLKNFNLDVIYCIGWSYLLDEELFSMPRLGVIGFHPAKLPQNRGRHPIIWALALGLSETASTFFKIDRGVDSGPILSQEVIKVDRNDDANSLYNKVTRIAEKQIVELTGELAEGKAEFVKQDEDEATYWRKRTRKDGLIDFRMSAEAIYNLVRALAPPYPCAEFLCDDVFYKVAKSEPINSGYPKNIEPGKVLKITGNNLLIKTEGEGAIWLLDVDSHTIKTGDYL
ncbi:MAG: formyl transferase [Idiomarinaceae bacterium]|uniref:formyltransferase family protein n=1 Tax=Idiomarina sp. 28-8 TaxID=1260624 RepID=UPI0002E1EB92|nr:formyltransferase family protein [Idiomarina sp. 28-8]NWO02288.1 formyl transferase [Idiomarinaceae bacterium]